MRQYDTGRASQDVSPEEQRQQTIKTAIKAGVGIILAFVLTVGIGMAGCPQYEVYTKRKAGEAELAKANFTREVAVREAQAKLDAAKLLNQAEVARAEGLAQAAQKVIDVLGGPDAYLRYLWIQNLEHGNGDKIYIPTEAGLPILEARQPPKK